MRAAETGRPNTARPADAQPAGSERRLARSQRRCAILRRVADLEHRQQQSQDVAPAPGHDEKRWLYSQIEVLQKRIRTLEGPVASPGSKPDPACPAAVSGPTSAATASELSRLRHDMDTVSSSSESEDEPEPEPEPPADSGCGGGGEAARCPPEMPTCRRLPPAMLEQADWADNPLWHSGPPTIGATDIGPMSHRLHDQVMSRPPSAPLRPGPSEATLSLLQLLRSQDGEVMTSTLLTMSSSAESCAALRQGGGLPLVVQLIHAPQTRSPDGTRPRPDRQIRSSASHALHNLVHSQGDDKRARREARVLRLLEQLRSFTEALWQRVDEQGHGMIMEDSLDHHPVPTVVALMKLSFDEEHRGVMCHLGGLYTVAELIQADHEAHGSATAHLACNSTRRFAGMTLTNLTFGDGTNKTLLCGLREFMRALVAQLHSPNEELNQVTASVLRNLSWRADAASKQTLREVGAVTALTQAAMAAQRESSLKSTLSALWNLSAHCGMNKADICAVDGALAFLVKALTYESPSNTTSIVENGGGILRNVSSHIASREDYRQTLRDHNCLQTLLHQLKSSSLTIVSNACGTLWNLSSRCAEDQRTLWELGAVSMLRSLIHSRHQMIAMGSSAALKNLLAARPDGVPRPVAAAPAAPGLPGRRLRALQTDLAGRLTETCDNLDAASAGRPEARFLVASVEPEAGWRVLRSDSRDSVRSTLSEPGAAGWPVGGRDLQLAAAVAQVARHAGVTETELRRLLLRPRAAGWTGSLPRVCGVDGAQQWPARPHRGGGDASARPSDDCVGEANDDSDGDTVRVVTTDSSLSIISTDSGLRSRLRDGDDTPNSDASARATPREADGEDVSLTSVSDMASQSVGDVSSSRGAADSASRSTVASKPPESMPFGDLSGSSNRTPASPRQLRKLAFAVSPGKLPPSPRTPRRSASHDIHDTNRPPPSPKLPRKPASDDMTKFAASVSLSPRLSRRPNSRELPRSPCKSQNSSLSQRNTAFRDLPESSDPVPRSPQLQRRTRVIPRSASQSRTSNEIPQLTTPHQHSPRYEGSTDTPSPQTANGEDGSLCEGTALADDSAEPAVWQPADAVDAARRPVSTSGTTRGRQLVTPATIHQPAAASATPRTACTDGATQSDPAAAEESRIGRPAGYRPGQQGSCLPQPASRLPQRLPQLLPQRMPSASSPTRQPGQTWSVQQYHRRSDRQSGDEGGEMVVQGMDHVQTSPHRASTATLPAEWKPGSSAAPASTGHLTGAGSAQMSARHGWQLRMCASADRPLSCVGSDSASSDEPASDEDEDRAMLERCICAALPKSRSEASCLGRRRVRRPRRDRPRRSSPAERDKSPAERGKSPAQSPSESMAESPRESADKSAGESPPRPVPVALPPPPSLSLVSGRGNGTAAAAAVAAVAALAPPRAEPSPPPPDCMTTSQVVARDASAVAAALDMSRAVMAQSSDLTSSLELLEGVGPPSMLDSGASINGFLSSGSLSNGRSPLLGGQRRPSVNNRFVPEMMRRALAPHSMQESAEGLNSISSCHSLLDQVKPPSYMEELDMENSMLSVDSLRSEVVESRTSGAENLVLLEPPSLFHEVADATERYDSTVAGPGSETVGSDTEMAGQEELPLDPPELSLHPYWAESSPVTGRRTARDRRRASPRRYRTFTRPGAASDDTSSAGETTLTPGAESAFTDTDETLRASTASASARRTCRQRRQQDPERYCTQTVETGSDGLQRPTVEELAPRTNTELRQLAHGVLRTPRQLAPTAGRLDLRQLAQEAQKAIVCLRTAGRASMPGTDHTNLPLPNFPAVPPPLARVAPPPPLARIAPPPPPPPLPPTAEDESESQVKQRDTPVSLRPRIVKPNEETRREPAEEESEPRGVRGKRKPLYSAPRRSDAVRRDPPAPARQPLARKPPAAKMPSAIARSSSASATAACPVRGTKTTQLRKVLSGSAAGAVSRGSRSATPSPASSATSSPQLGLRRFGSAGKAGVVSRELPRPASTPTAAAATRGPAAAATTGRPAARRPVSVPVAVQSLRLHRPAWVDAVRPSRPITAAPRPAAAAAAAAGCSVAQPKSPDPPPPPPPPLVKQGTFTLDEPTQTQTAANAEAEAEHVRAPLTATRPSGQTARTVPVQPGRPPPKSHSGQPLTAVRSRIPKSPSYESTLSLRARCSSQSPSARRPRPPSPRRGRTLCQSASNSSISARVARRAGQRSTSNSSASSGGSPVGRPEEVATGKMAALWRRIEQSRAKQQQQQQQQQQRSTSRDSRIWLKAAPGQTSDANANRPAEPSRRGPLSADARLVFTPQGWRRLLSPAQSPTEARPNATAVIPPFNYNPPGDAGSAPGDATDKRKRKSAAVSAT